ncbi:MAG TPA: lysophospholipid acyltransferase family protein [Pseudomonadota bacterium]|nr:lysophospholipid acyltransferase family protein [Pseudomonadota bacterium]
MSEAQLAPPVRDENALALRHRYEGPFFRRLMLGGIRHLPRWLKRLTMPFWGGLFYVLIRKARHAVLHNLDAILGPCGMFARHLRGLALFHRYAQMLTDTYQAFLGIPFDMPVESIGRTPELLSHMREHGAILATGHIGWWQIGPFLHGWHEMPPFYIARAEEPNPLTQQWEERFQKSFRIIYTNASPFSVLSLAKVLREKSVVGMQIDRVLGGHFHWVRLCGKWARFPVGPALLARMTGSPLIPSFFMVERNPGKQDRLVHHVGPALFVNHTSDRDADLHAATEQLAEVYERIIRRYPDQFFQFFDFFFDAKEDGPKVP